MKYTPALIGALLIIGTATAVFAVPAHHPAPLESEITLLSRIIATVEREASSVQGFSEFSTAQKVATMVNVLESFGFQTVPPTSYGTGPVAVSKLAADILQAMPVDKRGPAFEAAVTLLAAATNETFPPLPTYGPTGSDNQQQPTPTPMTPTPPPTTPTPRPTTMPRTPTPTPTPT